jgi:two-component system CheB/CheR fusion protein
MEFTLGGDDGARRYFEANGRPVRSVSDALGGVVTIRDISERSLHHLQDEFLALASHELRTPLTPLLLYLQQIDKFFENEPESDGHQRARLYLAHSQDQVLRLRRLVQDLLDVRRLRQGGFNLELERVPLERVVARSVDAARLLTPVGMTITLEGAETALIVEGDPMRLQQVLMNLLTNAITYAPRSPRIAVRLRREGSDAVALVQDSGPGIPAASLPQIFARYYQVARTDERPSRRGLGLGLYIAHALMAAHGGSIEVTSTLEPDEEHGTTFTVRLPLAPPATSDRADAETPSDERKQRGQAKRSE